MYKGTVIIVYHFVAPTQYMGGSYSLARFAVHVYKRYTIIISPFHSTCM